MLIYGYCVGVVVAELLQDMYKLYKNFLKKEFFFMILAFAFILLNLSLASRHGRDFVSEFLVGTFPYIVAISPLVGLILGAVDVKLSSFVIRRVDEAVLELDMSKIMKSQSPYLGGGVASLTYNVAYVLGEEAIRGGVLMALKYDLGATVPALLAAGALIFLFARAIPWYLRLVKLIDDFVLTVLFLTGGVLSAWIAHAVMNAYILWPLVKHE